MVAAVRPWSGSDLVPMGVSTMAAWTTNNFYSIERTELLKKKSSNSNSSNRSPSLSSLTKHLPTRKKNCANHNRPPPHRDYPFIRQQMREPSRSRLPSWKTVHSWLASINRTGKHNRPCWTPMTRPIVTPSLITAADSRCSLWPRMKSIIVGLETCRKGQCQRKR